MSLDAGHRGAAVAEVEGARRRHPCSRPPVPIDSIEQRMVEALAFDGAAHPTVAAAVLAVRGRAALERTTFARRCGISVETLAAAERGDIARDQLPGVLRRMVPPPETHGA